MGLVGRLMRVKILSKKQCWSMYWRMRAAIREAIKNASKQQLKFQYDPSSYALNFDDGCYDWTERARSFHHVKFHDCSHTTWVYVIWVEG
ncbi:hypothetical protein LIER_30545 [Lithospermum erythrorhizon]|uniref:Uncharacterized protein n=1 Tax=Lithospermum erythrorhizon TaxID=34254 RepID=A0AAV3RRP9_LITER